MSVLRSGSSLAVWRTCSTTTASDVTVKYIRYGYCVGDKILSDLLVRERITLTPSGGRTIVVKDIEISNHGIPWFFLPLIWVLNRFGTSVGPDKLKQLCEANV